MSTALAAPSASGQTLTGSALLHQLDLSALRREVIKILAQKQRVIASFDGSRIADILKRFMEMPEVMEINQKFKTVDGIGPFSSLIRACERESLELRGSELLVSIFGSLKVGKSTLGNLLLEKRKFETSDTPMTSFVTTYHSSPECRTQVTFVPYIESALDIKSLFLVAGLDDPEMEQKYVDLLAKQGKIEGDSPPQWIIHPPPQLRYTPIVSHMDIYGPIWDVSETGIAIADCPGTKEIGALSNVAHHVAANSAVLVYVCDGASRISKDDEDILLVREQLHEGNDVLFVVNKKPENEASDVERVCSDLRTIFGDLVDFDTYPIHSFDFKLDRDQLIELQRELAECLHRRTRLYVSVFLNYFMELIRAMHLFVSRLLTLHVSRQAENARECQRTLQAQQAGIPPSTSAKPTQSDMNRGANRISLMTSDRHKTEVQAITRRLKQLWTQCKARISELNSKFGDVVVKTAEEFDVDMRTGDKYEAVPVPVQFNLENASQQSFFVSVFNPQENQFEREFRRQLQMRLNPIMEHKANVFARNAKREFANYLMKESMSIEASVLELKSEQSRLVWNKQSAGLFSALQNDLSRVIPKQKKVAGMAIGAVGIVGTAALSAVALAGLIAGGILITGGALVFIGLVATGIGLSASSLIKDMKTENSERMTRKKVLHRLTDSIKRSVSGEHFAAYRQQMTSGLDHILTAAIHAISTNLIEIESLWYLDQCHLNIAYSSLCSYLWLRDELTEVANELLDDIRELDHALQLSDSAHHSSHTHFTGPNSSPSSSRASDASHLSPSHSPRLDAHSPSSLARRSPNGNASTHGIPTGNTSANFLVNAFKMEQRQAMNNTRHDSCYVCWRQRTQCGHLCRDCDFLIGAEKCPYCHELPRWISSKIKMSDSAKRDLEAMLYAAPPPSISLDLASSSSLASSTGHSLSSSQPLSNTQQHASQGDDSNPLLARIPSLNDLASSRPHDPRSLSPRQISLGQQNGSQLHQSASSVPSVMKEDNSRFVFDEQGLRVQAILVGFKPQIRAFCNWFESKYTRYITDPAESGVDVPEETLASILYFVNSIISQIPSIESSISYTIKLRIIESTHEVLFARLSPLVHSLIRNKFRLLDEQHQSICKRGQAISYEGKDPNDWTPSKADSVKLNLAIETLRTLENAKSPYAKFQVWSQVWKLIHEAHSVVIAAEESWAALTYVITHTAHPHMVSDGYIITKSLELLLEGEGYLLTTVHTFSTASLMDDVVTSELSQN